MSYNQHNRYHNQPSPWATGAPPGMSMMQSTPMGPAGYGPAMGYNQGHYGMSQQNMRMSHGGGWGQPMHGASNISPRGSVRHQSSLVGKRNASWNDNGHMAKRQSRGPVATPQPQNGGGSTSKSASTSGPATANQKQANNRSFQNRVQNRNRNNQQNNRRKQTINHRRKYHLKSAANSANLELPEYSIVAADPEKNTDYKTEQFEAEQNFYVNPVFGWACSLCNLFFRDKNARAEHIKLDSHTEKFNKAEEERKLKEAEQKALEDAEKIKTEDLDEKEVVNQESTTNETPEDDQSVPEEQDKEVPIKQEPEHEEAVEENAEEQASAVVADIKQEVNVEPEEVVEPKQEAEPEPDVKPEPVEEVVAKTPTRSGRGARGGARGRGVGRGRGRRQA